MGISNDLLELPAGKLDGGEKPAAAAARELEEETGLRPGQLEHLFSFYSTPGFCDEIIRLYVASDLEQGETKLDADEFVELKRYRFSEAVEMVRTGKIVDCKSVATILYARAFVIGVA